jgi:hypothetical protein
VPRRTASGRVVKRPRSKGLEEEPEAVVASAAPATQGQCRVCVSVCVCVWRLSWSWFDSVVCSLLSLAGVRPFARSVGYGTRSTRPFACRLLGMGLLVGVEPQQQSTGMVPHSLPPLLTQRRVGCVWHRHLPRRWACRKARGGRGWQWGCPVPGPAHGPKGGSAAGGAGSHGR